MMNRMTEAFQKALGNTSSTIHTISISDQDLKLGPEDLKLLVLKQVENGASPDKRPMVLAFPHSEYQKLETTPYTG